MKNLLNKTIAELSEILKNSDNETLPKLLQIKKALESKNPDDILLPLQKSGILSNYYNYWERTSKCSGSEVKSIIADRNSHVIHVLIAMHVLLVRTGKKSKIVWHPPAVAINYQLKSIQPAKSDYQRSSDLLRQRVTRRGGLSMIEFAEKTIVTAGPKKGQRLSLDDAPYARRPLELMSPENQCQLCVLMWAAQSMKSVIAQIVTAYYVIELPSEILYAMADKESMRKTMDRRLVPMLSDLGVEFISSSVATASRKTGDITFSKEFNGGNLDGITANSTAALAAETKRIFIADEAGQWRESIGSQGSPFAQGWARLKAWLDEKKCLVPSTPTDEGSCLVHSLFLDGTQEEWWVPCAICGKPQILEVRNRDGYGLDWRTSKGRIIENSIVYVCQHCGKSFAEKKKYDIQQGGEWRIPAGVQPINRFTASLHLHSINSNFESWFEIASKFEQGLEDPIARKNYDNFYAGQPTREKGARVESSAVQQNKGEYPAQTVPDGVLYLTAGADVQGGAERWRELTDSELMVEVEKAKKEGDIHDKKFPRIEIEILGSGPSYRSWSIDYQIFYGNVDNAFTGAWERLNNYAVDISAKNGGFGFRREKDNKFFPISLIFIDSGHVTSTVYNFSQRWGLTFPCKGERMIVASKDEKNQQLHSTNFIRYKKSRVGHGDNVTLYTISTKLYKKSIYSLLSIKRIESDIQSPGFQDFPREYPSRYFDGLTAEEKLQNGEYDNKGRYNEPIDARVYAACGADVYLDQLVENTKIFYKTEHKYNEQQLRQVNHRFVILSLAKKNGIDPQFLITKTSSS